MQHFIETYCQINWENIQWPLVSRNSLIETTVWLKLELEFWKSWKSIEYFCGHSSATSNSVSLSYSIRIIFNFKPSLLNIRYNCHFLRHDDSFYAYCIYSIDFCGEICVLFQTLIIYDLQIALCIWYILNYFCSTMCAQYFASYLKLISW